MGLAWNIGFTYLAFQDGLVRQQRLCDLGGVLFRWDTTTNLETGEGAGDGVGGGEGVRKENKKQARGKSGNRGGAAARGRRSLADVD